MNVALVKPTEQPYGDLFAEARSRLPGDGLVASARKAAFDDFAERGLPHRRIEEWKYTDLRALLRTVNLLAPAPEKATLALAAKAIAALGIENTCRLTLVDGVFAPELSDLSSLEKGVRVQTLRDALGEGNADLLKTKVASDAMISLNTALATDGLVVTVDDGVTLNQPLHIAHIATASSASAVTRSHVRIGNKARVTLVESFVGAEGASAYQVYDQVEVSVGDDTELQHVRLMEDARDAANITTAAFRLGARVKLNTFGLTQGAAVSRYQGFITFAGEGSELSTNGVNLLGSRRHGDTTLIVDHTVPNCISREVFRAVLDDQSHSVFQGRIIVRQIAQKTDGKMMTRALLLSDEAEADNKPELEIFADDVACGHGATAGAIDEELLFYLRARGLPEKEAQGLLIAAFVGEAIESIVDDDLRDIAIATAERWLAARG
ncbi:Fe-S cluster assembly protein SufD [Afipia felis]|uniref:FeS cluster assembly protein sufD n=2 Tax=Afipia felis TaxID=1035 RepID=A0A380WAP3_AFIFE|nr:Fe-S cluster assembly protein SufD [Afipia felis]EKS28440.1 FeS assembly protein SufD [Afipia felis ATCC 53690]SUU77148.1 FeS cluster assembly protein sufD [Afipia felis]SUU85215.1 FeS cluster assembly protein sufD [Afipia felis]